MTAAGLLVLSLGLVTGLAWRSPRLAELELQAFTWLNGGNDRPALDGLWAVLRPLGRGWFILLPIAAGVLLGGPAWLSLAAAAALLAAAEQILKRVVGRRRPYQDHRSTRLRLRVPPTDPSFPSGDAARAGLMTAVIVAGTSAPGWLDLAAAAAAVWVAAGRVRAGVHYPTDVWAGGWLGFGLGLTWAGLLRSILSSAA